MQSKTENTNKKKIWLIPACILLAVAFLVLVAVLDGAEEKSLIEKKLQKFYSSVYVDFDYEGATNCLASDVRKDFQSVMCMGTDTPIAFDTYRNEAIVELENNTFSVEVRLNEIEDGTVSDLAGLQNTYPGTEKAVIAHYDVVFIPDGGEEKAYDTELFMLYKDGGWYMSTYLPFPIGPNMYVSHEA